MSTRVLEPQPTGNPEDPGGVEAITGWLNRLRAAAEVNLPVGVTLTVGGPRPADLSAAAPATVDLPFTLAVSSWDAEEFQYRVIVPARQAEDVEPALPAVSVQINQRSFM